MNILNMLKGIITQKELLNYCNASIVYEHLPIMINGYVFNYDNVNFIIVNKNLSYYKKKKTILHELAHIELNQLNQADEDLFAFHIQEYEDEADKYLNLIYETIKLEKDIKI
ncbi:MAG TPA: hypothetical protein DCE23_04240 [Firmicutes bacterium]|nr:hypothetical protein [Bacillota bacterium]